MNAVVVDNEENAANYLVGLLEDYKEITVAKVFHDAVKALVYLLENECDMIFLDIEMANINGIYIAQEVLRIHPQSKICFITAYNDFAVKAFELNAIDYILKPYSKERLDQAIYKIKMVQNVDYDAINSIGELSTLQLDIICGYDEDDIIMLSYQDIYYIEVVGRDLYIHTKDKIYRGNKTLNFYEKKFKSKLFFRVHKSYIVNLKKINRIKAKIGYNYDIYFCDIHDVVPISRSKMKELKRYMNI